MTTDVLRDKFNENVAEFHMALAEQTFDRAAHEMLRMEAFLESEKHEAAKEGTAQREVFIACREKLKKSMLGSLQRRLLDGEVESGLVIWEKCKSISFSKEAANVYETVILRDVQQKIRTASSQLQASRELLYGSMKGDTNRPHVEALTAIMNVCANVTKQLNPLGKDIDVAAVLTKVHAAVEPFAVDILKSLAADRQVKQITTQISRACETGEALSEDFVTRTDSLLDEMAFVGQVCSNYLRLMRSEGVSNACVGALSQQTRELVVAYYVYLETVFMHYCVGVAIGTAEISSYDGERCVSTICADCFYVFQRSVQRSTITSSVQVIVSVLHETIQEIEGRITQHLLVALRSSMKAAPASATQSGGVESRSSADGAAKSAPRRIRTKPSALTANDDEDDDIIARALGEALAVEIKLNDQTLSLINTFDVASQNLHSMHDDLKRDVGSICKTKSDLERFDVVLGEVSKAASALAELGRSETEKLCERLMGEKISQCFRRRKELNFNISADEYAQCQSEDPFASETMRTIFSMDAMCTCRRGMTATMLGYLLGCIADIITRELCTVVMTTSISVYGAMRLSKYVRQIAALCQVDEIEGLSLRSHWARLRQILFLLNLEKSQDAYTYRDPRKMLSAREIKSVLLRRVDFRSDVVERLRLEERIGHSLRSTSP